MNPSFTSHHVTTDGTGRNVTARFLFNVVNYTGLFGHYVIEARDTAGSLEFSYPLSGKVQVQAMAADNAGNVYVGGTFMETMYHGVSDSLAHVGAVGDTLDVNAFLIKLDANGSLVWARNVEPLQPDLDNIADIRIDAQQNPWYAYNDFFNGHIQKLNAATGADIEFTRVISGVRGISSFDFDPQNNIFLTGAAEPGEVFLAPLTYNLTDPYNIYIAKFDHQGVGQWAKFAHDITFQEPFVEADPFGKAFVGGMLMDSMTWGSFHLNPPQWVSDFWLVKITGDGMFEWAKQAPQPMSIQGDVARADGNFLASDAAGDVYMLATVRGVNDFGNGVVVDAGVTSQSNMAVINFSGSTGQAQWSINGGANSFNGTHDIAVDNSNNVYFTQTLTDTADYGSIHFDIAGWTNHFAIGKISGLQDTTITLAPKDRVQNIQLYPNPAVSFVTIPLELQGMELMVFDAIGREAMRHQVVSNPLNIENLAPGVYHLFFHDARIIYNATVIKE